MGSSKEPATTVVSGGGSTERQPTADEAEFTKLQLEREKFLDPQIRATQSQGLGLAQDLLTGSSPLPGFLGPLSEGLSEDVISDIVAKSLNDVNPQFQQSGLFDSGVRASAQARTAGDIRRSAAEFNIGNLQNLLNLALSGQAQVQQPILGFSSSLSNRLQSTGNTTTSFNQTSTKSPVGGQGGFSFF